MLAEINKNIPNVEIRNNNYYTASKRPKCENRNASYYDFHPHISEIKLYVLC